VHTKEELQEAIGKGQEEWEQKLPLLRLTEYSLTEPVTDSFVPFVTGIHFWEQAEALVMAALDDFATYAANGKMLLRKLFVDDALRGLAFVDQCRQRFDVVLMNPPFGYGSVQSKRYVDQTYPTTKYDVLVAFVERSTELLANGGLVGALGSRTIFFIAFFTQWRASLLGTHGVMVLADLGLGVLDTAMVETAGFVIAKNTLPSTSICLRILSDTNKVHGLLESVSECNRLQSTRRVFPVRQTAFLGIEDCPFAYWVPATYLSHFTRHASVAQEVGDVRVGLQTGDDFRFIRAAWEVEPQDVGKMRTWVYLAKGGEYQKYYSDLHLVVKWENNGEEICNFRDAEGKLRSRPQNIPFYFRAGITYPMRTRSNFSPRVLPAGCIFNVQGNAVFPRDGSCPDLLFAVLGVISTAAFESFTRLKARIGDMSSAGGAGFAYTPGLVQTMPFPKLDESSTQQLAVLVRRCVENERFLNSSDETTRLFVCPPMSNPRPGSIRSAYDSWVEQCESVALTNLKESYAVEGIVRAAFRFSQRDVDEVTSQFGRHVCQYAANCEESMIDKIRSLYEEPAREDDEEEYSSVPTQVKRLTFSRYLSLEEIAHSTQTNPSVIVELRRTQGWVRQNHFRDYVVGLLQHAIGCVVGRWDVRYVLGERQPPEFADPLAPLPVRSPGMLQGPDGQPLGQMPIEYPLRIDWDGILVDDPDHPDDIKRRVREVLELVWKDQAEAIEKEACEALDVKELGEYFRKTGKGSFWDDHIARYSKSRRKAPIYWLLQSSKKSYAFWLYYHRLDKDLLFKALVQYVEPKIQRETNHLDEMRRKKQAAGESGKEAKKLDKDIERQEDLISELQGFYDKVQHAARLHLEPDLNDGVVLNIAPLHELVPWREAEEYWEELLEGKYEWSSIGKQLRQKGMVK
jgi:hypothetical protein